MRTSEAHCFVHRFPRNAAPISGRSTRRCEAVGPSHQDRRSAFCCERLLSRHCAGSPRSRNSPKNQENAGSSSAHLYTERVIAAQQSSQKPVCCSRQLPASTRYHSLVESDLQERREPPEPIARAALYTQSPNRTITSVTRSSPIRMRAAFSPASDARCTGFSPPRSDCSP